MTKLGVVLSGGGARGAYEVGVLSYVLRDLARRHHRVPEFRVIAGTSVGAINGTFLASIMDQPDRGIAGLERIWETLALRDVLAFGANQLLSLPRVLRGGHRPSGVFDARALAQLAGRGTNWSALRRNIDDGVLDAVCVTATQVMNGRPVLFVDARPGLEMPGCLRQMMRIQQAELGVQHVLASAAIPLLFPPVAIDGRLHCDGGLRASTPLAPVVHLGANRVLVVGLSAKSPARESGLMPGEYPGAAFLLGKVLNAFLLDPIDNDLAALARTNAILRDGIERFGPEFVDVVNRAAEERGEPPRRPVQAVIVRPSRDLGVMAAEYIRSHKSRFGGPIGKRLFALLDMGVGNDSDIASYLLFDGGFASELISLGRKDARAHRDEIEAAFFGADVSFPEGTRPSRPPGA